jgi:hypothetical protein
MDQVLFLMHKNGTEVEVRQAKGGRNTFPRNTVYGRAILREDDVWWRICPDCDPDGEYLPTPWVMDQKSACLDIVDHQEAVHRTSLQRIRKKNPFRAY